MDAHDMDVVNDAPATAMEEHQDNAGLPSLPALDIIVKTVNNQSYNLMDVSPDSLISDLKNRLFEMTTIEADRQRLIYRGHVMDDENSIQSYNIETGHTVHMVARPVGVPRSTAPTQESEAERNPASVARMLARRVGIINGTQLPLNLLNPLLTMPSITRSGTSEIMVDSSLEPIRQNILTMNTLMTTLADRSHAVGGRISAPSSSYWNESESKRSEGSDGGSDEREGDHKFRRLGDHLDVEKHFFVGQWIDVKDTVNQWLAATVMDIDLESCKIFIHFNGWPVRWDEWIDWNSNRVAPFRSHTSQDVPSGTFSPSLSTRETSSLTTGRDDVRLLLPEVLALMHTVSPMMQALCELSTDSLPLADISLANSSTPHASMPWMAHLSRGYDPMSPTFGLEAETSLRNLADELCPVLDRFGRLLADLSPHLRLLANSPVPVAQSNMNGENNPQTPTQRTISQSDTDGYRRIINSNRAGGLLGSNIGGHLDIHIHAILSAPPQPRQQQHAPLTAPPQPATADDSSSGLTYDDDVPPLESDDDSPSEFESVD